MNNRQFEAGTDELDYNYIIILALFMWNYVKFSMTI